MRYLHTMVRVADLDAALDFYCAKLGLAEIRRIDNDKGRFTLVFLAAPEDAERAARDQAPMVELTYNWDSENYTGGRNFGHLAYRVKDIYAFCAKLMDGRRHHQPPAARRPYGVRALARRDLDRASAGWRQPRRPPSPGPRCPTRGRGERGRHELHERQLLRRGAGDPGRARARQRGRRKPPMATTRSARGWRAASPRSSSARWPSFP